MFELFDDLFDMDHDGKLSPLETSMKWAAIAGAVDEDERREMIEDDGLDPDDSDFF
ncbi:MAG: hypothetical protein LUG62_02715 [Clostridiales bacterium]|nr:hypothetical protein [Clostridiales bacterium]